MVAMPRSKRKEDDGIGTPRANALGHTTRKRKRNVKASGHRIQNMHAITCLLEIANSHFVFEWSDSRVEDLTMWTIVSRSVSSRFLSVSVSMQKASGLDMADIRLPLPAVGFMLIGSPLEPSNLSNMPVMSFRSEYAVIGTSVSISPPV